MSRDLKNLPFPQVTLTPNHTYTHTQAQSRLNLAYFSHTEMDIKTDLIQGTPSLMCTDVNCYKMQLFSYAICQCSIRKCGLFKTEREKQRNPWLF